MSFKITSKFERSIWHNMLKKHYLHVIISLLALSPALLLASNSDRGFDITDQSYYLLSAFYPEAIKATTTLFGYYTGALYRLTGENIASFRLSGILILVMLALALAYSLQRYLSALGSQKHSGKSLFFLTTICVSSSMVYYQYWILTPSYNWLALVSVSLTAIGLLEASLFAALPDAVFKGDKLLKFTASAMLVGFGGYLAFMAKPTTAIGLALIALYWLIVTKLRHKWLLFLGAAIATALGFMLLHIYFFDEGVIAFTQKITTGMELGVILGGGHNMESLLTRAKLDFLLIPNKFYSSLPFSFSVLGLFFVIFSVLNGGWISKIKSYFIEIMTSIAWIELTVYRPWHRGIDGYNIISVFLVLSLSVLVISLVSKSHSATKVISKDRNFITLILFFLFLPISYSFGSNNGFVRQMAGAFLYFGLAWFLLVYWGQLRFGQKQAGAIPILVIATSFLIIYDGYKHPYRLTAQTNLQTEQVQRLGTNSFLKVDHKTASYIHDLQDKAVRAGWQKGMFLLDMTGSSPGAVVMLSGQFLGDAWLIGGYKGSASFVQATLTMVSPVKLKKSWILTTSEGKRKLPFSILKNIHLNFPTDYINVGSIRTGYRNEKQLLWRPK